ncbi:hypothetical protein Trydic_g19933, partial [Trypoxylus dichotomus]
SKMHESKLRLKKIHRRSHTDTTPVFSFFEAHLYSVCVRKCYAEFGIMVALQTDLNSISGSMNANDCSSGGDTAETRATGKVRTTDRRR